MRSLTQLPPLSQNLPLGDLHTSLAMLCLGVALQVLLPDTPQHKHTHHHLSHMIRLHTLRDYRKLRKRVAARARPVARATVKQSIH